LKGEAKVERNRSPLKRSVRRLPYTRGKHDACSLGILIRAFQRSPLQFILQQTRQESRNAKTDIHHSDIPNSKERPNFQHIVAGNSYRSDDHRRAVEQISFQLLRDSIAPLQNVRKFRKSAKSLLEQIEIRNAAGVLSAVDRLEPKLKIFVGT
jgi:hypothetical protein